MKVHRVRLNNFRNYQNLDQKINNQLNFFLGPNGSGKTNFIEALYCCLRGQSFRNSRVENLSNNNSSGSGFIEIDLESSGVMRKIKFSFQQNRKFLKIDEKASSSLKNMTEFPMVLFSPESLSVIKSGPSERRELVDQITLSLNPGSRDIFQNYQRALKARNRTFKNILEFPEQKKNYLKF